MGAHSTVTYCSRVKFEKNLKKSQKLQRWISTQIFEICESFVKPTYSPVRPINTTFYGNITINFTPDEGTDPETVIDVLIKIFTTLYNTSEDCLRIEQASTVCTTKNSTKYNLISLITNRILQKCNN